ncbi:MAG: Histidine triad domain protein [Candidatus Nomurabacteria bacterium]|nr:Histidine triad domain protein [Candidatus Nomurabacteria bacterium]
MTENKKVFVDINNVRNEEMRQMWQKIIDDGVDPFDLQYLSQYHPKPILKVGKHWFVTENNFIYPNAKHQFLFITIKYAETLADLEPEASAELLSLADEYCTEYNIQGGALCMRFGRTSVTGASVKHLHAQLIESDIEQGTVVFPIGKRK